MMIDNVDEHDDEQAPAFLWESEAYHQRLVACLSTVEISKFRDMSEQLQDQSPMTTTTVILARGSRVVTVFNLSGNPGWA